jgi:hypothetical protein
MERTYLVYNKLKKKLSLLEKVAITRYKCNALPSYVQYISTLVLGQAFGTVDKTKNPLPVPVRVPVHKRRKFCFFLK